MKFQLKARKCYDYIWATFSSSYSTLNSRVRVLQIAALQIIAVSSLNVWFSYVSLFNIILLRVCDFCSLVVALWLRRTVANLSLGGPG
jgi:hypothetical protein